MSSNPNPLEPPDRSRRVPSASYRLQFHQDFTFQQAGDIAEYLRALGVDTCYASPLFKSGPQSTHGYDICGFGELNPCLGGAEGFDRFASRLQELGLGLLLDMVPNHMGNDLSNAWWRDVLEHGRASAFAPYFDIDWEPIGVGFHDQVLLPTLEDHYGKVLEAGKLELVLEQGGLFIKYYDRHFPLAPHCYATVLEEIAAAMPEHDRRDERSREVQRLAGGLTDRYANPESRADQTNRLKLQIQSWATGSPSFAEAWEIVSRRYRGEPGKPRSFDALDALVRQQNYRLAFWRVGPEEINYRRFFDVTSLVSVKMELPLVFHASHQMLFELIKTGKLQGLRIDHPDGLWDPKEYFRRLQTSCLSLQMAKPGGTSIATLESGASGWITERMASLEVELLQEDPAHPQAPPRSRPLLEPAASAAWPLYTVVEKILSSDEPLRRDWPVDGTTGYEFLNQVNGLFVDRANEEWFDSIYRELSGFEITLDDLIYASKERILRTSLASELTALTHRLRQLALRSRDGLDFTLSDLRNALRAVIAAFPVYRTYVTMESREVIPRERVYIQEALADAAARQPKLEQALFDFLRNLLLLHWPEDFDAETTEQGRAFVMKFQQLTGPVMAKGLEDTAFYRYNRLISLNEVGEDPSRFGLTLDAFHQHNLSQARHWPHSLLATATHDTKRGEDARARINVLSEMPQMWQAAVQRWRNWNAAVKTLANGTPAPDANDEYLLYQTLVGAWPVTPALSGPPAAVEKNSSAQKRKPVSDTPGQAGSAATDKVFKDRFTAYMRKATREAKTYTTWTDPNSAYEEATTQFVESALDPTVSSAFLEDFALFQLQVAFFGELNSLSQVLLKCTAPGVPDFYQGSELWDLSLVDPDNRRPVDYELRRKLLTSLAERLKAGDRRGLIRELLAGSSTGQVKLFVIRECLHFRQQHRPLFDQGEYVPLAVSGARREHVCAFLRKHGQQVAVVAAPRLVYTLTQGIAELPLGDKRWADTSISLGRFAEGKQFHNLFTGEKVATCSQDGEDVIRVGELLNLFPVALLYAA